MHELDFENKSDRKDNASEKGDHLTITCPVSEANASGWESNIIDAGMKEGENFASIRIGK
jgi:hypothetical protein